MGYGHKKRVSLIYRTATTAYPCYLPVLGEFCRSWSYMTYPGTKVRKFLYLQNYSAGILLKEKGRRPFTEPIALTFVADPTIIAIGEPLLFSLSTITCTQAAHG